MAGERGAYARGLARRDEIMAGAIELFSRIGYRNATILDIATHVGISRTGLLHHFPSKEALLKAILRKRDVEDLERLAPTGDPLEDLGTIVALARHNARVPNLVSLFAVLSAEAGDPSHPAHDYFIRRYAAARASMAAILTRAQDAGLLVPGLDVDREARDLVALMDGLQVQWLLAPDQVDMADDLHVALERLLVVPLPD
ncbi:MAG TPA: TetR/AcrR family transcriptional regulator [Propionibacteriaceae bacterium]|nr:TetR/AcrR family transcriptional regulator [Propionibacteriaceae bacterium]